MNVAINSVEIVFSLGILKNHVKEPKEFTGVISNEMFQNDALLVELG